MYHHPYGPGYVVGYMPAYGAGGRAPAKEFSSHLQPAQLDAVIRAHGAMQEGIQTLLSVGVRPRWILQDANRFLFLALRGPITPTNPFTPIYTAYDAMDVSGHPEEAGVPGGYERAMQGASAGYGIGQAGGMTPEQKHQLLLQSSQAVESAVLLLPCLYDSFTQPRRDMGSVAVGPFDKYRSVPRDALRDSPRWTYGAPSHHLVGDYWTEPVWVPVGDLKSLRAVVIDRKRALSLRQARNEAVALPPIEVGVFKNGTGWLVDGNHRLAVARGRKDPLIEVTFTFV